MIKDEIQILKGKYKTYLATIAIPLGIEVFGFPYFSGWLSKQDLHFFSTLLKKGGFLNTQSDSVSVAVFLMLVVNILALTEIIRIQKISPSVLTLVLNLFWMCVAYGLSLLMHWTEPRFTLILFSILPFPLLLGSLVLSSYPSKENHLRGAQKIDSRSAQRVYTKLVNRILIKKEDSLGLRLWKKVALPKSKENEHILIIGSPGAGKTQLTYPLIFQAIQRGDKSIVWDIKGTFTEAFASQDNIDLMAPWDERSMGWNIRKDIRNELDCQQMAAILIPANIRDHQPYFSNMARQILETVFCQLHHSDLEWGWRDVWLAISNGREDLVRFLKQSPEGFGVASAIEGDSKSGQDVYSTLLAACTPIKWFTKAWDNTGGSLRDWVRDPKKSMIISGSPDRRELATMCANLAIQIMINDILSLPDDLNRRIWFFLDELATLGRLMPLLEAFSLGRSKGLCIVAGIQDIGKLEHLYGSGLSKSMSNTFSTVIVLRCSDSETSRWASQLLGEEETNEKKKTKTEQNGSPFNVKGSVSESETTERKPIVLASEISNLEDLHGILRVPGWPVAFLTWPLQKIPRISTLLIEAKWVSKKEEKASELASEKEAGIVSPSEPVRKRKKKQNTNAEIPKAANLAKSNSMSPSPLFELPTADLKEEEWRLT